MVRAPAHPGLLAKLTGRTFVHPLFDYMLIGGGLSLLTTAAVLMTPRTGTLLTASTLPYFILLSNSAHFAASTVRLYTKPGAYSTMPFATMALPLVTLAVLTLCMFEAGRLGPHLQSLFLTWSPYHYAAQAYGLAVMYCYRSGCLLSARDKSQLWWISMLPFFYAFLKGNAVGFDWLMPREILTLSLVQDVRSVLGVVLMVLAFGTPVVYFAKSWRSRGSPLPLISMLLVFSNGIWWFLLIYLDAFIWATIFHGIQYLAIVIIFHLRDQMGRSENRHGRAYHVAWFYLASLALGYGLFNVLPLAFILVGFGKLESVLLVVATINIHHFIVDGYIWRLKKSDGNRRIVDAAAVPAAA